MRNNSPVIARALARGNLSIYKLLSSRRFASQDDSVYCWKQERLNYNINRQGLSR